MFKRVRLVGQIAVLVIAHLLVSATALVFAQQAPVVGFELGQGLHLVAPDSSMDLKFSVRFQNVFSAIQPFEDDGGEYATEVRRLRFMASGFFYDPKLTWSVHHTLDRGQSRLFMAYMDYKLGTRTSIGFGQIKLPGNREFMVSSGRLLMVDRPQVSLRFMLFFDKGIYFKTVQPLGKAQWKFYAAFSGGEGPNTSIDHAGYNYTARFELLPFGAFSSKGDHTGPDLAREESFKLSLGGAFNFDDEAVRVDGERGAFITDRNSDLTTWFADAIMKYKGLSLMAEYYHRMSSNTLPADVDTSPVVFEGRGYVAEGGLLLGNKNMLSARFERILPSHQIDGFRASQTEALIGFSRFVKGHVFKLQVEGGVRHQRHIADGDITSGVFRGQLHINL